MARSADRNSFGVSGFLGTRFRLLPFTELGSSKIRACVPFPREITTSHIAASTNYGPNQPLKRTSKALRSLMLFLVRRIP
jgi:hypothetical protein